MCPNAIRSALPAYRHRIGVASPDLCTFCECEPGTAEHLFRCPGTVQARLKCLRSFWESPSVLATHPELVADFLKEIGFLDD
eukprot:gene9539-8432_t